jgi:hypothetical protein
VILKDKRTHHGGMETRRFHGGKTKAKRRRKMIRRIKQKIIAYEGCSNE